MSENLKNKTIKAAMWRMAEMLCQRAGTLVVSIVLARLLMPEEFGTVALLTIFIQLAGVFINAGFGQALIQRKNTTPLEESSVFFCNIAMAVLLYGVLYFVAPLVPLFYDKPELTVLCPLLRVSALSLIIGSFGQVQASLLAKQLRFKPLFIVSVATLIVQAGTGISLAYGGYGVWALAWSGVASGAIRVVLINCYSNWKPDLRFSFAALGPLFDFGWKLLASGLLDAFFVQIYGLLIGRFYTAADLAFYNSGKAWPQILALSLSGTISSVLFPVLSLVQDDVARIKIGVQKSLQFSAFLLWPCLIGLAWVAEPLISVLLTDKWLPAAPYMRVLCFVMCLYPVHAINLQVLTATGRSDLFLRLEVIKKTMTVVMLFATVPFGIMAMVYGQLVQGVVALFINAYYTNKIIGYSLREQAASLFQTVTGLGLMSLGCYALSWVPAHEFVTLGLQAVTGAGLYLLAALVLKNSAYFELRKIAIERLNHVGFVRKMYGKKI